LPPAVAVERLVADRKLEPLDLRAQAAREPADLDREQKLRQCPVVGCHVADRTELADLPEARDVRQRVWRRVVLACPRRARACAAVQNGDPPPRELEERIIKFGCEQAVVEPFLDQSLPILGVKLGQVLLGGCEALFPHLWIDPLEVGDRADVRQQQIGIQQI